MTRTDYLQDRNINRINLEAAWELYQNTPHPMAKVPVNVFVDVLNMALSMNALTMELYFTHYDNTFQVNKLIKQDGSFIYI